MRTPTAIDILSAAYRLDLDERQWLVGLAEAARGCIAHADERATVSVVRTVPDGFVVERRVTVPEDAAYEAAAARLEAQVPPEAARAMHRFHGCITASEYSMAQFGSHAPLHALYRPELHGMGIRDVLNVQGVLLQPLSLVFTLPLRQETALHPRLRHTFNRVAAHLAAALRLRLALDGAPLLESAHAVLSPDGRCLHAHEPERTDSARERLREAARAVDRAQGRLARTDPEEAIALWTGLFAGRWSLLDTFDTDGKRFVLALRNEPRVVQDRALTRREQQVASLAAAGQCDKLIAYTLGLAESTVRTHLRRGLSKLGVGDRRGLARVAEVLLGPPPARS